SAQPQSQAIQSGSNLVLSVTAGGTMPLSYQWQRSGTNLVNATNQSFIRVSAQMADFGSYRVIISNCVGAVTSSVATVQVSDPPVVILGLTNQFWKYEQSGADLGTAWREIDYDDSAWPSGRGVLAQETDAAIVSLTNTVLSLTGTNGTTTITYYFRTHFTLTNEPESVMLTSSNLIDDGAVVYLNGMEAYRINLPLTPIDAGTLAPGTIPEGQFIITNFPPGLLRQGDNVMAVEVHQLNASSTDIVFGMALFGQFIPPGPPIVAVEPSDAIEFPGRTVAMSVNVSSGTGLGYQWFHNGTPIASATKSTLLQTNISFAAAGFYQVIMTNIYGAATSRVAIVSVIGENAKLRLTEFTNLWRFNLSASNLGTIWRTPAYDDSGWLSSRGVFWGPPLLDCPEPTNTVLALANGSGVVITTYYFRTHFALPAGLTNLVLLASNLIDDGAVFHLNGAEYARIRLNGAVSSTTFASTSPGSGSAYETIFLTATNLVPGDNVLAVEVHQATANSSDAVFGMNLTAYGAFPQSPVLLTQPSSRTVNEGSPTALFADVLGGQLLSYQWFRNGGALTGETNTALQIPAVHGATAGNYHFTVTNLFGAVTSVVATVSMISDFTAPALVSAYITNGAGAVAVVFSEPITAQSATNIANYSLSPSVGIVSVQQIAPNIVVLFTTGLDVQVGYTVGVSNIIDQADVANMIAPGAVTRVLLSRPPIATGLLQVQTVFIILMENQSWVGVKGSTNLPYLNSLLPQASYCDNYFAHNNAHPSEPNYIWLEAGDDFGYNDDFGPAFDRIASTNHLATQLSQAGIEWRGYMEDMAYGSVGITNGYPYLARHNPFAFFDDVTMNYESCTNHVRPYAEFAGDLTAGRIGRYNFITPNVTNDMHSFAPGNSNLGKQGDDWLARELPQILSSSAFSNNGAVFITWDENDYSPNNAIGMIVLSPLAKG
ncbi:MAG TPA: alkaline phosphatase family protein, partial [Verrucomicrobiae bacterium]